jgi:hypothetical protein
MSFDRNRLISCGVPNLSALTAINAGGRATSVVDNGGIYMSATNLTTADDFRSLKKSAPTAPYVFTVHLFPTLFNTNYSGAGVLWRASSTGNAQFFGVHAYQNSMNILIRNESASNNGASPTYTTGTDLITIGADVIIAAGPGVWLQMVDDGVTNRLFRYSLDGLNFLTLVTTGRTTTITPDEIGVWIGNVNSGGTATVASGLFDSWTVSP